MTAHTVLLHLLTRRARQLLLCCLMSVCSLGWAQLERTTTGDLVDHHSVQQLMRQARYAEALVQTERYLTEHPRDPQMLFMRAKSLMELRRTDEALDHEARDHAVKNGFVEVPFADVRQKVGDRLGCFLGIEFQGDHAVVEDVQFNAGLAHEILTSVRLRIE